MATVTIMRDGERVDVDEATVRPVIAKTEKQADLVRKAVAEAPTMGFGGPQIKDLLHGHP